VPQFKVGSDLISNFTFLKQENNSGIMIPENPL